MLYRLKVDLLRSLPGRLGRRLWSAWRQMDLHGTDEGSVRCRAIKEHVSGKSFADIGCMWGLEGKFCFYAAECGASKVVGVDVFPASDHFKERQKQWQSTVKFVRGDINDKLTQEQVGLIDVVMCAGVLYHTPEPFQMLQSLRNICGQTLILSTNVVPEVPGTKNMAILYPFLNASQRKRWDLGVGIQMAITQPYDESGGYGNWFWGLTPSCTESLLALAGFEVKKKFANSFYATFICRAVKPKFLPATGDWMTLSDPAFTKHVRKESTRQHNADRMPSQ